MCGGTCSFYWLRSPGAYPDVVSGVISNGSVTYSGEMVSTNEGIRQALWIKLGS